MRFVILVFGASIVLAGCATLANDKAPVCDGKHRRPANLYGSVLNPASPPAAAPSAVPLSPAAKPEVLSAIRPASYPSCGA